MRFSYISRYTLYISRYTNMGKLSRGSGFQMCEHHVKNTLAALSLQFAKII